MLNLLFNLIRAGLMIAILAVLLEIPFAGLIVKLSQKVIPILQEEDKHRENRQLIFMVEKGELPSSVALTQARLEITRMGYLSYKCLKDAVEGFFAHDESLAEKAMDAEDAIDVLTDKIQERLIALRTHDYSSKVISDLSQMILVTSDMERISDYGRNIAEYT